MLPDAAGCGLRDAGGGTAEDAVVCCRCAELFDPEIEHVRLWEGRLLCFACVVEIVGEVDGCLKRNCEIDAEVRRTAAAVVYALS